MSRFEDRKDVTGTAFRKIDIDEYTENGFQDEETDGATTGPSGPDETEILQLLAQGRNADALVSVLRNAPLGSKNQQIKDNARNLTQKVLLSIKSNQMDDCMSQLDHDQVDILMKYIYRGFEIPTKDSSAHLLLWHEKVYNANGIGSIMRVLSDGKRA